MKSVKLEDHFGIIWFFDPAPSIPIQYPLLYLVRIIFFLNQGLPFPVELIAFFHPRHHCFVYQTTPLPAAPIPSFIHCEDFHFLLLHLFMVFILHGEPYAVHLFKQHRQTLPAFRLSGFHLFYGMVFFLTDPLAKPLYQVPCASMADALAAGFADDLCCYAVRRFGNRHGDFFCQVCREQPDLIHVHGFIQQVYTGLPSILQIRLVDSSGIAYFPVNGLDRSHPLSLIPVLAFISSFCQFRIIVLQQDPGDLLCQFTDISENFLLQCLERYQLFLYNRFHHTVSFICFSRN